MNYKEFYTDSLDIFMRFINVNLKIEENYKEVWTVLDALAGYYGRNFFVTRFAVSLCGTLERRHRGEEKYDLSHYKTILGNVWRFHKKYSDIQHNDSFRNKVDADCKELFRQLDNQLERELMFNVRSSLILQSLEFESITDEDKERWRIEPLLPRQKGGKTWGTEKKNIQKAS